MTYMQTGDEMSLRTMIAALWSALGGRPDLVAKVDVAGEGSLPSIFAVSDFAASAIATAGIALAEWTGARSGASAGLGSGRRRLSVCRWLDPAPYQCAAPPEGGA